MFGEIEGRAPITCIDSAYTLPKGKSGARIFTDAGEEMPILVERIRLMNEFFLAAKRGESLVKTLIDLDLLRPVTIDAKFESAHTPPPPPPPPLAPPPPHEPADAPR